LFDPLQMGTATFLQSEAVKQKGATLYGADGVTPYPYWHLLMRPAGSLNASAAEMARYVQFYLNRGSHQGKALLPASSIDRMEISQSSAAGRAGLRVLYG